MMKGLDVSRPCSHVKDSLRGLLCDAAYRDQSIIRVSNEAPHLYCEVSINFCHLLLLLCMVFYPHLLNCCSSMVPSLLQSHRCTYLSPQP